jgi:ribosomal protein L37AE/L43A
MFKTIIISIHNTRAKAFEHEEYLQKARKVVTNPMYINRSYANAKFTLKQHSSWTRKNLKNRVAWNKGLKLTDEFYKKGGRKNKGKVKGPLPEQVKDKLRGPNPKKALFGERNSMFGKTHTEEVKAILAEKASNRFKGKSYEELYGTEKAIELKNKRSTNLKGKNNSGSYNPMFGTQHKESSKQLQSQRAKNRPKLECPHCGIVCASSQYKRWHGDRCRFKVHP